MDLQFVTQFMLQHFEQTKISNGGTHFLARCLLCGDSKKNPYKKRFNLDWNNGVPGWKCWNCGKHGNFITLYSIVSGVSYDDAKKELFKYKKEEVKRQMGTYKKRPVPKKKKVIEEDNFNFLIEKFFGVPWIPKDGGMIEKKYLKILSDFIEERKIPKEYLIFICHSGKYKNRIIIPIFENRNIIYFQARRIPKSGVEPKYDNPVSPKELCILNKNRFDRSKNIIIHEGLIDAFMVGKQGTSCLGKEISEDLIKELLKLTDKNVIVALDNDSEAYKALDILFKKNKYAKKVKYFLYPSEFAEHDDINSIVRMNEGINVYEMITQNSVSYSTAYTKLSISKLLGGNRK
ncbi:MAG: toprim domain-containing protein [Promethearchaeota archaeon]|jgi:DNA primase